MLGHRHRPHRSAIASWGCFLRAASSFSNAWSAPSPSSAATMTPGKAGALGGVCLLELRQISDGLILVTEPGMGDGTGLIGHGAAGPSS